MQKFDVLIIGGGICGLTAAIYAARANLSVCIVEKEVCGGLVNWTHVVENVPSYKSIHGLDLMAKCREHAESLGVSLVEVEAVTGVDLSGELKLATTAEETYAGRALIVATGRKPLPLPVQTEFENVHYCAICDGAPYKGKDVVVVGGGNSGFDESLYLAGLGVASIHILEVFPQCIAAAATQDRAKRTGIIRVDTDTRITALDALDSGRGRLHLDNCAEGKTWTEDCDAVFCFIGQKPNTDLFQGFLDLDKAGYIVANADMETNVPGVFAAGDVIVKKYRQIVTAMGDGAIAALQAEKYIRAR